MEKVLGSNEDLQATVIVPSYNSEKYIKFCLESIASQKDVKFEVIIIDDKGDDNTRKIISEFQKLCNSITIKTIYRDGPSGQASARNEGIDSAIGEYIVFLDSDDTFYDDKTLFRWINYAKKSKAELVVGQFWVVQEKDTQGNPGRKVPINNSATTIDVDVHPELANCCSCWQILYQRNFLEKSRIKFSHKLKQREDRPFFLECLLAANEILVVDDYFIIHRMHTESSFKLINADQFKQYLTHLEILNRIFYKYRTQNKKGVNSFLDASFAVVLMNIYSYWGKYIALSWSNKVDSEIPMSSYCARQDVVKAFESCRLLDSGCTLAKGVCIGFENKKQKEAIGKYTLDLMRVFLQNRDYEMLITLLNLGHLPLDSFYEGKVPKNEYVASIYSRYLARSVYNKKYINDSAFGLSKSATKNLEIYIHVGYPKTGTSSFQNYCELNRHALAQQGYYFPLLGISREHGVREMRTAGHAQLFNSILNNNIGVLRNIFKEVSLVPYDINKLILSSENICSPRFWNGENNLYKIKQAFPFSKIKIVGLFRDQFKLLQSWYREMIGNHKNGFTATPREFLIELKKLGLLEYDSVLSIFKRIFGSDNVFFFDYEKIKANTGVEHYLLNFLDIKTQGFHLVPDEFANKSMDTRKAFIIFCLKRLGIHKDVIEFFYQDIHSCCSKGFQDDLIEPVALDKFVSNLSLDFSGSIELDKVGGLLFNDMDDFAKAVPFALFLKIFRLNSERMGKIDNEILNKENLELKNKLKEKNVSLSKLAVENKKKNLIIEQQRNLLHEKNKEIKALKS